MAQRGRKSAASLAVVRMHTVFPSAPKPPSELPVGARQVWEEIVRARPHDFFDSASYPVLCALCVAKAEHARASAALATIDPQTDTKQYAALVRATDALAGRIGDLSTKLRLTLQARVDSRAAGRAAGSIDSKNAHLFGLKAPWETKVPRNYRA
jgi:hypothetical protein